MAAIERDEGIQESEPAPVERHGERGRTSTGAPAGGPVRAALTIAVALALACGGGDPGAEAGGESTGEEGAAAGELTMPDWMQVDREAESVVLEIVAGATPANNYWNFQGLAMGEAEIVVPQGYSVQIEFRNDDQSMAHSLGIDEAVSSWPAMFQDPQPVFDGAITSGPAQIATATQPGESETISFTAGEAGEYAMVCYVPGHAIAGMWIYFTVSAEGEAGLRRTQ